MPAGPCRCRAASGPSRTGAGLRYCCGPVGRNSVPAAADAAAGGTTLPTRRPCSPTPSSCPPTLTRLLLRPDGDAVAGGRRRDLRRLVRRHIGAVAPRRVLEVPIGG